MSTRLEMALNGLEAATRALLGRDATADQMGFEDYESGLVDALTNLMHFAERYDLDWFSQLDRANKHYEYERQYGWGEEPT